MRGKVIGKQNCRAQPFELLAALLAPDPGGERAAWFRRQAALPGFDWRHLLFLANAHLVTPLWYAGLERGKLLDLLPEELHGYLRHLYQASRERNALLRDDLLEFLNRFAEQKIAALLLKGAATFADELYADSGLRVMRDLDILLRPQDLAKARQVLVDLGYEEQDHPEIAAEGWATDERHHHLPLFCRPGAPAGIELHFKVAYGQAGRALPTGEAWQAAEQVGFGGRQFFVLHPTHRLLHNALHALLPHRESIRANISLLQLAEFCHLAVRYRAEVDWRAWHQAGCRQGVGNELLGYLTLAEEIMGFAWPEELERTRAARRHAARYRTGGRLLSHPDFEEAAGGRRRRQVSRLRVQAYYLLHLPAWVWKNVCYAPGTRNLPSRIRLLLRKLVSPRSLGKVFFE